MQRSGKLNYSRSKNLCLGEPCQNQICLGERCGCQKEKLPKEHINSTTRDCMDCLISHELLCILCSTNNFESCLTQTNIKVFLNFFCSQDTIQPPTVNLGFYLFHFLHFSWIFLSSTSFIVRLFHLLAKHFYLYY